MMTNKSETDRLSASALEALNFSDEKRIEKIRQDRWIGYGKARQALAKMEDLLTYPPRHRMPCLLIVSDTNNGKTMIAHRFLQLHPINTNMSGEAILLPALLVQAPPVPDEGRFYNNILSQLFTPYKANDRAARKYSQVLHILRKINLKMLIIDEIHDILAGSTRKQLEFLNVIKNLSNELAIPIVGLGTRDALRAMQTDPQIANRFEPFILPRWSFDTEFLRLLASFEKTLPLKKASVLTDQSIAQKLFSMSEGTIGELARLISIAAVYAIQSKEEQISLSTLSSIDWISPSDRRKAAERAR